MIGRHNASTRAVPSTVSLYHSLSLTASTVKQFDYRCTRDSSVSCHATARTAAGPPYLAQVLKLVRRVQIELAALRILGSSNQLVKDVEAALVDSRLDHTRFLQEIVCDATTHRISGEIKVDL